MHVGNVNAYAAYVLVATLVVSPLPDNALKIVMRGTEKEGRVAA